MSKRGRGADQNKTPAASTDAAGGPSHSPSLEATVHALALRLTAVEENHSSLRNDVKQSFARLDSNSTTIAEFVTEVRGHFKDYDTKFERYEL